MSDSILSINNLSSGYGAVTALRNISVEVAKGSIITLIGSNGAGKSSLLMSICGILKPWTGTINYNGQVISGKESYDIMSMGIAQVPEGRHIFPDMSVRENLLLGSWQRSDGNETIDYVLDMFPVLKERFNQSGGTLSGGEQQMLAIGRAIMAKPLLLLLDEPSLGLAPIITAKIFEIIEEINKTSSTTILLVEQNANLALKCADYGYVLATGEIVLEGKSDELLNDERVREFYLGA